MCFGGRGGRQNTYLDPAAGTLLLVLPDSVRDHTALECSRLHSRIPEPNFMFMLHASYFYTVDYIPHTLCAGLFDSTAELRDLFTHFLDGILATAIPLMQS